MNPKDFDTHPNTRVVLQMIVGCALIEEYAMTCNLSKEGYKKLMSLLAKVSALAGEALRAAQTGGPDAPQIAQCVGKMKQLMGQAAGILEEEAAIPT